MPREELHQVKLGTTAGPQEKQARRLAEALRHALPARLGFTLFIFDQASDGAVEDPSHVSYISSANREDMVDTIRVWLAKVSP